MQFPRLIVGMDSPSIATKELNDTPLQVGVNQSSSYASTCRKNLRAKISSKGGREIGIQNNQVEIWGVHRLFGPTRNTGLVGNKTKDRA